MRIPEVVFRIGPIGSIGCFFVFVCISVGCHRANKIVLCTTLHGLLRGTTVLSSESDLRYEEDDLSSFVGFIQCQYRRCVLRVMRSVKDTLMLYTLGLI